MAINWLINVPTRVVDLLDLGQFWFAAFDSSTLWREVNSGMAPCLVGRASTSWAHVMAFRAYASIIGEAAWFPGEELARSRLSSVLPSSGQP